MMKGRGFIISWTTLGSDATRLAKPKPALRFPRRSLCLGVRALGTCALHGQATQEHRQHQLPGPCSPSACLSHPQHTATTITIPLPRCPWPLCIPRVGSHHRRRLSGLHASPGLSMSSVSSDYHIHPSVYHRAQRSSPSPSCHHLNI